MKQNAQFNENRLQAWIAAERGEDLLVSHKSVRTLAQTRWVRHAMRAGAAG